MRKVMFMFPSRSGMRRELQVISSFQELSLRGLPNGCSVIHRGECLTSTPILPSSNNHSMLCTGITFVALGDLKAYSGGFGGYFMSNARDIE